MALFDFGVTDDDIAETTEEIGSGILDRRTFSSDVVFPVFWPLVTAAELVVVDVAVDKNLVLAVCGCLLTANKCLKNLEGNNSS